MPFRLFPWQAGGLLLAVALAPIGKRAAAQTPCPPAAGTAVQKGWQAYRADSLEAAAERFSRAEWLCPGNLDALVGRGFTLLRQDRLGAADALFRRVLARDTANADAWEGRAWAAYRRTDVPGAVLAGRRALALKGERSDLRALMDRIAPEWERPPC
jgi:predicted Zn-dependent protease